jgi:hypothetical protein
MTLGRATIASIALTTWLAGCAGKASLPDYAAPKGRVVGAVDDDASADLIPYRTLTRDDFKGSGPPPEFAAVAGRIGAATCARVSTTPDTRLLIVRSQSSDGEARYRTRVEHLRFQAWMDRACSWWNDKVAAYAPGYVLEHEQLHFATFEIAARRMNASLDDVVEELELSGSSPDELQRRAQAALEEYLQEAADSLLERNRDFDADTSLGYKPDRQKEWLGIISAELEETRRWAASP